MKTTGKLATLLLVPLMCVAVGSAAAQSAHRTSGQIARAIASELGGRNGITVRVVSLAGSAPIIGTGTGQDTLELGNASYASERSGAVTIRKHQGYFSITTEFGLKLVPASSTTTGAATLSAYLVDPAGYCSYYLDGIRLTTSAQPISLQLRYGTVSTHRLEIRVPVTAPAGPVQASISWVASSSKVPNGLS